MILIVYVSTTLFITQGNYIGYIFRLLNSYHLILPWAVRLFASEVGVYPLLLLSRGNARFVLLSHTMTIFKR